MQVQIISDTIQKFNGVSYYRCGPYFQRKGKRLHRAVWEFHNGEIPEGCDIHHMDGNRANNDISNLQMLQGEEHGRLHMSAPERIEKSRKNIKIAAEAAKPWHRTEAGQAFHSRHAKEVWEHMEPRTCTCTYCGKEFQATNLRRSGNVFCCNKHKTAWRLAQGIDNETRTCPVCGTDFVVNKYAAKKYCSQDCARKARWGK